MTDARSTPLPFAEQYRSAAAALPGHRSPRLRALREKAVERARRLGAPTPRVERWKYTNLQPLLQTVFTPALAATAAVAEPAFSENLPRHRILLHNGMLAGERRPMPELPAGVTAESIADLLSDRPDEIASVLESEAGDGLLALNAAFMADGCRIRIASGAHLHEPLALVHLGDAAAGPLAFHPRHVVIAEPGSRATILEVHEGSGGVYWSNPTVTIEVGAGAELRHYVLLADAANAFHIGRTFVKVASGGRYDSFVLTTGGRLTRNEIGVSLEGEGASCRLAGGYLGRERQHCDTTTEIVHASPRTASREVYKGVLDGQARGVFQGRIVVEKGAQKSDGHQLNKTLLLSDRAEIDTKPELEIYADDVKCSHGAAAGELDEAALFYLRARGIGLAEARRLLIHAFLGEALEEIEDRTFRGLAERRIAGWLDERAGT